MADSPWKPLPDATKADKDGNPVPVLLFLPTAWHKADAEGRPVEAAHARVVGWWDDAQQSWVTGIHPKAPTVPVYPSLWAPLTDEPVLP